MTRRRETMCGLLALRCRRRGHVNIAEVVEDPRAVRRVESSRLEELKAELCWCNVGKRGKSETDWATISLSGSQAVIHAGSEYEVDRNAKWDVKESRKPIRNRKEIPIGTSSQHAQSRILIGSGGEIGTFKRKQAWSDRKYKSEVSRKSKMTLVRVGAENRRDFSTPSEPRSRTDSLSAGLPSQK